MRLNREASPPVPSLPASASRFLRPQELRRFKNFQFAAKLVVEGFYAGKHRSPYYDASAEFADYRAYVPGDELRALDWRAYARTDRDYIKLFRKETDMRCHILLDASRSMAYRDTQAVGEERESDDLTNGLFGLWEQRRARRKPKVIVDMEAETAALSKFEYGAYLAAALAYLMIQQGDKASLALGATELLRFIPPGGTITHLHSLLYALEQTEPAGETELAGVLKSLFALTRRRGLLVIISDLLEDADALFGALSMYAHRGWQIVLFHVLTDSELQLPGQGPVRYLDAESSRTADADPNALRAAYQAELQGWLDGLEMQAKARRIHYTRLTTSTPYDRALERYLTSRKAA